MAGQLPEELKAELDAQRKLLELFTAYAGWASSASGAVVLKHLRDVLLAPSYKPGRDALEMAWWEGRRALVQEIDDNVRQGLEILERGDATLHQAEAEQGDIFEP